MCKRENVFRVYCFALNEFKILLRLLKYEPARWYNQSHYIMKIYYAFISDEQTTRY